VPRWHLPDGWVISNRPAHPALVSEADFIAAQDINAARGAAPQDVPVLRRYLLAGLLACGMCGRRMGSAWSNGKAAYRCRHGRSSAMAPDPARPKNTYVREDKLLPHLQALHLLLTTPAVRARRRTRAGADVRDTASPAEVIAYLREHEITLTWNPAAATVHQYSSIPGSDGFLPKFLPKRAARRSREIISPGHGGKPGRSARVCHQPPSWSCEFDSRRPLSTGLVSKP
jgi:hypothetical protein